MLTHFLVPFHRNLLLRPPPLQKLLSRLPLPLMSNPYVFVHSTCILSSLISSGNKAEGTTVADYKEDPPKSPSILSKLLASLKNAERRVIPSRPKKEKKEDVKVGSI
jgi:hypothetical protein